MPCAKACVSSEDVEEEDDVVSLDPEGVGALSGAIRVGLALEPPTGAEGITRVTSGASVNMPDRVASGRNSCRHRSSSRRGAACTSRP